MGHCVGHRTCELHCAIEGHYVATGKAMFTLRAQLFGRAESSPPVRPFMGQRASPMLWSVLVHFIIVRAYLISCTGHGEVEASCAKLYALFPLVQQQLRRVQVLRCKPRRGPSPQDRMSSIGNASTRPTLNARTIATPTNTRSFSRTTPLGSSTCAPNIPMCGSEAIRRWSMRLVRCGTIFFWTR